MKKKTDIPDVETMESNKVKIITGYDYLMYKKHVDKLANIYQV
jgi:hypothetical protein